MERENTKPAKVNLDNFLDWIETGHGHHQEQLQRQD